MDNATDQTPKTTDVSKRSLLALALPVVILVAAGVAFLVWSGWTRTAGETSTPGSPTATSPTPGPTDQAQAPEAPNQTATAPAPTSTSGIPAGATGTAATADDRQLGGTVRLFQGDVFNLLEKDGSPAHRISAVGFTDSRCPEGVQCIWAGERGVELQVAPIGTQDMPRQITLSETTRRTAQVPGLKLTLIGIDDGKGGTYADVKFE